MSPTPAPGDDTLAAGTDLGRYRIVRLLGRGGMGAVYEGIHRDLKKRVAIKVLSTAVASEEAKQRFLREGEAASRIQHPNVVDVTDVGTEGTLSYMVMEYLEGEDLAHRLVRDDALSMRETADLFLPICAGLSAAHDEGVVHRDLKPENIFLVRTRQGGIEPKVLDFGISKVSGPSAAAITAATSTRWGWSSTSASPGSARSRGRRSTRSCTPSAPETIPGPERCSRPYRPRSRR
jgi:serine/threonine-protein kinase